MKCIHCETDSKYSDRKDGKCPNCRRAFAFEPKSGDKFTDPAFKAAIERVSAGGTVQWTPRHLYYEIARRVQRRGKIRLWLIVVLAGTSLPLAILLSKLFLVPVALAAIALISAASQSKLVQFSYADFEGMWGKWQAAHGNPKGLIVRKAAPAPALPARGVPEDIQHYSFDRAVVADRIETVDLLLANNFHFENNCAVFTAGGYPAEVFPSVLAMLRNNPKLAVYVLHDATLEGSLLAEDVRRRDWFLESARVVDVGLHADQTAPFKGCWQRAATFDRAGDPPAAGDARWFAKYSVELAVIRPEQVIKRLFRALSVSYDSVQASSGLVIIDKTSFGTDAKASDGGGDSFG